MKHKCLLLMAEALQAYPSVSSWSGCSAYHGRHFLFCSNYLVTITAISTLYVERWTPDKARALQFCCQRWMDACRWDCHTCIRLRWPARHWPGHPRCLIRYCRTSEILPEELRLVLSGTGTSDCASGEWKRQYRWNSWNYKELLKRTVKEQNHEWKQ